MPAGLPFLLIIFYIICFLMGIACLVFEVLLVLSIIGMVKANNAAKTDPETYLPIAKKKKNMLVMSVIGIGASLLVVFAAFIVYIIAVMGMIGGM